MTHVEVYRLGDDEATGYSIRLSDGTKLPVLRSVIDSSVEHGCRVTVELLVDGNKVRLA